MTFLIRSSFFAVAIVACFTLAPSDARAQEASKTSVQLPVTLEADQRTELRSRVEGYVAEVHGDIGDRVTKGQLLVSLDAPELQADVLRRQQMTKQAEASLGVAKGRIGTAEAKRRQAESARDEQLALRKLRISQRDRYAVLVQGGAVQKERLEEAEFAVMAVEAAMSRIEADIEAAKADVDAAKNVFEFAKSGIEVAKAELARAVAQDQLRQIKAPFSGIITDRTVDPGQLVSPGQMTHKPLLVIENVDVLRGVITVPAAESSLIRLGDTVTLKGFADQDTIKSPSGEALKVSRISQTLDMKTRTMRVEIDVMNPYDEKNGRYRFLSGQYGSATVSIR